MPRLTIAAVAATAAFKKARHRIRLRFRLTIAAVAATAAEIQFDVEASGIAASRLPQSRRLRPSEADQQAMLDLRLTIAAVAATAASVVIVVSAPVILPPHDCRSRGDCGPGNPGKKDDGRYPPHDCRSRGDCGPAFLRHPLAAVAPASRLPQSRRLRLNGSRWRNWKSNPPHDCRSRGDCGVVRAISSVNYSIRLTIAAVAATAALSARRIRAQPITRLTIAAVAATAAVDDDSTCSNMYRLTIAAVAATAASQVGCPRVM